MQYEKKEISTKNPVLAFHLMGIKPNGQYDFPKVSLHILDNIDVVFIRGVLNCLPAIEEFINSGKKVVFVEKNLSKIAAFIERSPFINHPNVEIIFDDKTQYNAIAWKTVFKKMQFIGDLKELQCWIDGVHMTVSDYKDFGNKIYSNIFSNLSYTRGFIDGKKLKNRYILRPGIVCGSGPSLEKNYKYLKSVGNQAIIIASGSAIEKLTTAGIKFHFGAYVDPDPPLEGYKKMKDFSFPLFYQNRMSSELFSLHQGPKIQMGNGYGWQLEDWLYETIGIENWHFDAGWNVGNFALNIAHFLGCNPIVTIGLDGGELKNRSLLPDEFIEGDLITRRDLFYGKKWNEQFIQQHKETDFTSEMVPFKQGNIEKIDVITSSTELDRGKLHKAMDKIYQNGIEKAVNHFLNTLKNGVDSELFKKAQILLDVELLEEPLYEYWLCPMWDIYKHLVEPDSTEVELSVARATFFQKVLSTCNINTSKKERQYLSGKLYSIEYYKEGLPHGRFETFYEDGSKKSVVDYDRGMIHGEFSLYNHGRLKRSGFYYQGKKEGVHRIWDEKGNLIVDAHFKNGEPVGSFKRYFSNQVLQEEIIYHDSKRFDKREYENDKSLKYEGFFKQDRFFEKKYAKGKIISNRQGIWNGEKIIWD